MKIIKKGIELFCVLLLGLMTLIMSYQIIGRYILGSSPHWSEKLILLIMNYFIFLSIPLLLDRNEHISFEYFKHKFFAKRKNYISLFQSLCLAIVGSLMSYYGFILMKGVWTHRMPTLGISESWNYLPLLLSGILILLFEREKLRGNTWR